MQRCRGARRLLPALLQAAAPAEARAVSALPSLPPLEAGTASAAAGMCTGAATPAVANRGPALGTALLPRARRASASVPASARSPSSGAFASAQPHSLRGFAASAAGGGSDGVSGGGGGEAAGGTADGTGADSAAQSLKASMDKLVDAAVDLVEAGKLGQAVTVLQQGIDVLGAAYPGSPEIGELHNQVALLLFMGGQTDQAATHAQSALELTQAVFGAAHPLTAHRLLRLASVRIGQGRGNEAAPLLAVVADILGPYPEDTGLQEAKFYQGLLQAGAVSSPSDVVAADDALLPPFKALASALGPDSMIVRLALGQHSRLAGLALDAAFPLGEAVFKQHIRLQEASSPDSPELGLSLYQLAVTYYAHDMLGDAGNTLQRAAALLRQHFPPDHDLVNMCMHRLGMVCAAGRDPRAAQQLLAASKARYTAQAQQQGGPGQAAGDHPLAHEADAGLAMAAFKSLDPKLSPDQRRARQRELLASVDAAAGAMALALGEDHLLVAGARRYRAQLGAMAA